MVEADIRKTPMSLHSTLLNLCFPFILATTLIPRIGGQPRIINGTEVKPPHKYPWMVSLYFAGCFSSGTCPAPRHSCGGAVINEHYVLTAAHCCFLDPSGNLTTKGYFVLTGLHERDKLEPWSQNLSIADCIIHELYGGESTNLNDIALIRVIGRIEFSAKVTPVNLPSVDFDVETDGKDLVTAIGWGTINSTNFELPTVLQETTMPLVTTDTCQRVHGLLEHYGQRTSIVVTDTMLCAGFAAGGTSSCGGDSGSPVMMLDPATKTYTQVGVTSWTVPPCGTAGRYTVSTALSKYRHWIQYHLQKCKPRTLKALHAAPSPQTL